MTTETTELREQSHSMLAQATALSVESQEDYERAGTFLVGVKALRKRIAETFNPIVAKAHAAHQEALKQRGQHDTPLKQAEGAVKARMAAYVDAENRRRRQEEARLAAEAARQDEERRLAEAEALESAGETEAAERVIDEPPPPPPVATRSKPKAQGVATREEWSAEIVDLKALVRAVAEDRAPISLVLGNEKVANQMARALKGEFQADGIRVHRKTNIAARA